VKPVYAILVAVAVWGITSTLVAWVVVVPVTWSVLLGLPVAACALLASLLVGVASPSWHALPTPDESLTIHQASTLSNRFAEGARDQHRFQVRLQPRLAKLALATLRQRPGLHDLKSLSDERARGALGDELHTLLTNSDARLPSPHRLAELLSRLEEK
jgi:hypothetical protein